METYFIDILERKNKLRSTTKYQTTVLQNIKHYKTILGSSDYSWHSPFHSFSFCISCFQVHTVIKNYFSNDLNSQKVMFIH